MEEASKWREIGKYSMGRADAILQMLDLHEDGIDEHVRLYLRDERQARLHEAVEAFDKSIAVIQEYQQ